MRAPMSWISEHAALPAGLTGWQLGDALIGAGLEVEAVDSVGGEISGPLVIGRVVDFVEEPQKNGKTIRWCHVDCGAEHAPEKAPEPLREGETPAPNVRGIVCGASNFAPGDHVVVALPGTTLPGGFAIASRKTYGHVSDGMICAEDELGIGDDHSGIMVLGDTDDAGRPWTLGVDALDALGVRDDVLDMPVTTDMGYCLSIRGLAREAAQALDVAFTDPVALVTPAPTSSGYPVRLETPGCPLFVALTVTGVDPDAQTPSWMTRRLVAAGMRPIALSVDISNYVMLETGQPNHCYDADALTGPIVVRQADEGEKLVTLDGVERALDPADLVIADDSGAIGLAGVMGGEATELREDTTSIVIEAASFDPVTIARTSRRHKLSSEASRRFERTVDQGAAYAAAHRVADLLVTLAGGTIAAEETVAGEVHALPSGRMDAGLPARILGMDVSAERVVEILRRSGVEVTVDGDALALQPPTWRPDLRDPYDYVEEVGTKVGLEHLPSVVPMAPTGHGYTSEQTLRRALNRALAANGFSEVLSFPFSSDEERAKLGLPSDDRSVRLANPLAETAPLLRRSLLPGLFAAVHRNVSRGNDDLALYEAGRVFEAKSREAAPLPGVERRPSDEELAAIEEALPDQPRHLAVVLTGDWVTGGWSGRTVSADWRVALAFADLAADALGLQLTRTAADQMPWHPGRCARLSVGGTVVGYAGELHPRVVAAFGLPERTAAAELDLDLLVSLFAGRGSIAPVSGFPVAKEDIALIVDASVPVASLAQAVSEGAGNLLEAVMVFDIYTGAPVPEGKKSVAFALRFRAPDRTLKEAEVTAARDAAVKAASDRFGAVLRSA
ncbi:phenylalanine--tRNA ligase subunit beta [Nigerium massiliense]|uniref:phenylalanine--tRNA ligase subunit beta n=1 Tax=Nigerium massiliense TaxID=1522317 RepID=UPI00058CC7EB|nr:phenylalanine--tRNA ligase subunit beta [Nigerium massiliense]